MTFIPPELFFIIVLALAAYGLWYGQKKVKAMASLHPNLEHAHRGSKPHSLPFYYGSYAALWCAVPAFGLAIIWLLFEKSVLESILIHNLPTDIQNLSPNGLKLFLSNVTNHVAGIVDSKDPIVLAAASLLEQMRNLAFQIGGAATIVIALVGLVFGLMRIHPKFQARQSVERLIVFGMMLSSLIAILTTVGIILSLVFESARFFTMVSPIEFLFGLEWSPQIALRDDQVASDGTFGAVPIFAGTFLITLIAILIAAPIGLFTAIYLSQYANSRVRNWAKPALEILAGVPTVVYGFFAALTVAPALRSMGFDLGLAISSESALAAGVVMGVMIIPFVSSLSDDVISVVPLSLSEASLGLGATKSETIRFILIPAALPGIVGALLLAISRAIGETMIVVMAAGLAANLTANPFQAVTTVTVQIVTLLIGDQEFDSPKTLAAFALGLVLFVITLCLNIIALKIVRKYQEQYD